MTDPAPQARTPPEIITAAVAAFADDGSLDPGATREVWQQAEPRVDGIFVNGTTGEFVALEPSERQRLTVLALELFGPDRTVVHVGAGSTHQALALLQQAAGAGARRFAAVTPYYLPTDAAGVAAQVARLAAALPPGGELYGYLFPDLAGTDVAPDQLPAVAAAGLDGVKLSGAASARVGDYAGAPGLPERFGIWSGNDADLPRVLRVGGRGVVSGVSGVCPEAFARLREACSADDPAAVDDAQRAVVALVDVLGRSIAATKAGLRARGLPAGRPRMSIAEPTATELTALRTVLDVHLDLA